MSKLTKEQMKIIRFNIKKMAKSDEQFIFMLYKNSKGSDNITAFSHGIPIDKLGFYLKKEINRGILK